MASIRTAQVERFQSCWATVGGCKAIGSLPQAERMLIDWKYNFLAAWGSAAFAHSKTQRSSLGLDASVVLMRVPTTYLCLAAAVLCQGPALSKRG